MHRLTTVLALLGCVLHATLLPWHAAARMPAAFDAATLAADLMVICHEGAGSSVDAASVPAPNAPADQNPDCLICKAMMGFQLAVLAAAEAGLLVRVADAPSLRPTHDVVVDGVRIVPRSRGPPLSL